MARYVKVNAEDEIVHVYHSLPQYPVKRNSIIPKPIYIHKHLLQEHGVPVGPVVDDRRDPLSVQINLHYGQCMRVASWIYGQPMWEWSPERSQHIDSDLGDLATIWKMFYYDWKDYRGSNACLDAIRDILVQTGAELERPLILLEELVSEDVSTVKGAAMLRDLLTYCSCASDGRSVRWIEELEEHEEFTRQVCLEFGRKGTKSSNGRVKKPKDPMARCAYHDHDDDCPPCGAAEWRLLEIGDRKCLNHALHKSKMRAP